MRILIASEFAANRFTKIAVVRSTVDGSRVGLGRLAGTLAAVAAKQAARYFAAEPAAVSVRYTLVGQKFRVDRIDE